MANERGWHPDERIGACRAQQTQKHSLSLIIQRVSKKYCARLNPLGVCCGRAVSRGTSGGFWPAAARVNADTDNLCVFAT